MKRTKLECLCCHRLVSKSNYFKHLRSHENNPKYQEKMAVRQSVNHSGLNCQYCGKTYKNKMSLSQHEIRCEKNINKIKTSSKGITAMHKANVERGYAWNKGLTKETDSRVAKFGITHHLRHLEGKYDYSHNKHSEATKEKIRQQKLELCANQGTNLCGKGLRGYYKGIYCQSSWELAFVIYCLDKGIRIKRNKKGFKYIFDNITRTYFPDFVINDTNYIEIKGYYDTKTKEKEKQFPKDETLIIYDSHKMKTILAYVKNKYGKDYTKMYNSNMVP